MKKFRPQYTYWTDRYAQLHRMHTKTGTSNVVVEWWAGTLFGWSSLMDIEGYQGNNAAEIGDRNGWEPMPFVEPEGTRAGREAHTRRDEPGQTRIEPPTVAVIDRRVQELEEFIAALGLADPLREQRRSLHGDEVRLALARDRLREQRLSAARRPREQDPPARTAAGLLEEGRVADRPLDRLDEPGGLASSYRLDGFAIERYADGSVAGYEAEVTVIDGGRGATRGTVQVGEPLTYGPVGLVLQGYADAPGGTSVALLASMRSETGTSKSGTMSSMTSMPRPRVSGAA